jgi:AraC-like DNA-binding protein
MEEFIAIHRLNHTDLNMYQCGTQECEPGHLFGPAVRDHYLIHYIFSGKGKFCVGDRIYHLQRNQGFLICPDAVTYYQADMKDPWSYSWVGFHGIKAAAYLMNAGLTMETPIFTCENDEYIGSCFSQMITAKNLQKGREIRLLGLLYLFLSQLMEQNGKESFSEHPEGRKENYIKKAIEYIGMNYSRRMSIAEIAQYIGLDRSYLGSIFRERLDTSLQDFLINYRIDKACELMMNESLSIGNISRSVGYEDPLLFSKIFRKLKYKSPREFRKDYCKGVS